MLKLTMASQYFFPDSSYSINKITKEKRVKKDCIYKYNKIGLIKKKLCEERKGLKMSSYVKEYDDKGREIKETRTDYPANIWGFYRNPCENPKVKTIINEKSYQDLYKFPGKIIL